ncbi:prephenate dehydratase [Flavobacterium cerinum]|uniref:prephenate dehydratase n=1 Tax=Flavobacterium cerinum TaxID=2502784 RepID=A0ABY5IVJ4_9FLAO|nr:prephenate dehydratase [Flavobacterium cerinum]UUC46825.1 prephenate dehydratase [Flavobacterium cerinum]
MERKIAIQGIKGSFHHQVAKEYFNESKSLIECMSFDELVKNVLEDDRNLGIMALENSIAGSIIPNYALIDYNKLHIIGEHYLDIRMNLMALPGQTIEDIREVHSHPIALLQCKKFFSRYPHIRLVEDADTAETARRIKEKQLTGIGAVAGMVASEMYELPIIADNIHTVKSNKTRFVIVKAQNSVIPKDEINKASLKFELEDMQGSLAGVLNQMNNYKLNLTKIQSMPIIEKPWQYSFFVDITFDQYEDYEKAKINLEAITKEFKVLGEYKKGAV